MANPKDSCSVQHLVYNLGDRMAIPMESSWEMRLDCSSVLWLGNWKATRSAIDSDYR